MIRPGIVWGVARAEMRQCRRLVRFWIFEAMAAIVGLSVYVYYMTVHWSLSASAASAAIVNPRYLIKFLGIYYLYFGFFFGLVFLGFDLRARDSRERIEEVVDSLPCSNLEWLLGRYLGILIPTWLPLCAISLVLLLVGLPFGESLEPGSLVTFVLPMALPGSCFVLGLTFLVTLIVRQRLLAAALLVAFLVALIVADFSIVPLSMLPVTDLSGGFSVPDTSDIIPRIIDARGLAQRAGFLLAGIAFVFCAALIYPRRDDTPRWLTGLLALVLLAGAGALCVGQVLSTRGLLARREAWKSVHRERSAMAVPDLLDLAGRVRLDPGRRLEADLRLRIGAPEGARLSRALFSLNPGLRVTSVSGSDGQPVPFEQKDGLLDIALARPIEDQEVMDLAIALSGRPDPAFAYLDSAFEPLTRSVRDSKILLLGQEPLIFDERFVALLPGVRWLPSPGTEIGPAASSPRADFFRIDLTVDLPEGWLAAGPGRREPLPGGEGRALFRFAPPAPVPGVALVAGRFRSAQTRVGDVTLEALVHPSHAGNLDFFSDAGAEIEGFIAGRLEEAARLGLDYPFDALTLVEVPSSLRGYAGGWRMDSALVQPAMILTREAGFPTARFDVRFRDQAKFEELAGGLPRAKRDALVRFFQNDFSGGNPFMASAKSFFGFQTAAAGPDALALDFVCETLALRLLTDRHAYFSVFHLGADLDRTIGRGMQGLADPARADEDLSRALIDFVTSRAAVWDSVLGTRLRDLDPFQDPSKTLDVLTLKGGAMAESLLDGLGRQRAGRLLAELRRRHAGRTFDRSDIVDAGRALGQDLGEQLALWIDSTGLPGFTLGDVEGWRLPDRHGAPVYQLEITVRNEEETPGLARLEYTLPGAAGAAKDRTEPIPFPGRSAIQVGLVTAAVPQTVRVVPYLALNRGPFTVPLPALNEDRIERREPFHGWRPLDWAAGAGETVVVDDLDQGFGIERIGERSRWRVRGRSRGGDLDEGLPVLTSGSPPSEWSRTTSPDAYGKYRHTMAVVVPGAADQVATFTADLPKAGLWDLEYHLPPAGSEPSAGRRGTWRLAVVGGSGERDVTFDADGGEVGWNKVTEVDLPAGEVQVRVSDATDGDLVVADAIRWTPGTRAGERGGQ
ncbi:MAG TPA: hypothetical protein VFB95_05465 [Candidatus Cryosericum sp.]|nr:hypothetical protein [Candidatus Cryosericum sp.]